MKIVHLMFCGVVTDNWNYQDNMLTKFHKKMGHEVSILTSKWIYDTTGELVKADKDHYINEDGVEVIRLELKGKDNILKKVRYFKNLGKEIVNQNPDIVFIHGCAMIQMSEVVRFLKKNPNVKVYVDNHSDFSNSATNWFSKNILHKFLWRKSAQMIEPYTTKFYGVLPARVEFLKNIYRVPEEKCELLVMGADDEKVNEANSADVRINLRKKYEIEDNDFLIVTGGKIDAWKTQTLLLMEAVKNINKDNVKLLIFGSVSEELQSKVQELSDNVKVQYIGWIKAEDSYDYFAASDLVVFPGRHSVFWEQVVAQGIPMICKYWEGTTHIDIGGNVKFLYKDSVGEIQDNIESLLCDSLEYKKLKKSAICDKKNKFMYSTIAKESIEML